MRVLVTRPREDAARTAAALAALGHEPVLAPLLEIRFRDGAEIDLDGVQAILVTSANGVRGIIRRSSRRDIPVFAVGPQSAEAARAAGYGSVHSADGDAAALAAAVIAGAKPEAGAVFHAAGAQTKGDLRARLEAAGFRVDSEVLYDAVAEADLPQPVQDRLRAGTLDAVLLYSPRSARLFAEAARAAGLLGTLAGLEALCISAAAAKPLAGLGLRAIKVAGRPDQAGLFALIR